MCWWSGGWIGLGRSLRHLIELLTELEQAGIGFQSITEAIDTTTPGGKLVFHIFGALAEFERNLIRERTKAGSRGRKGQGQERRSSQEAQPATAGPSHRSLRQRKHPVDEICRTLGISKPTLYAYVGDDEGDK